MTDCVEEFLSETLSRFTGETGGLISALHAVQERHGFLPDETEAVAADIFNLSRAEVKGVISFYADFARAPKGEAVVRVCAAEACQAVGGRALASDLEREFGARMGETAADGAVTLEPIYCLGLCSAAPAALIGDKLIARATVDKVKSTVMGGDRKSDGAPS